jgi:hypothetical protein
MTQKLRTILAQWTFGQDRKEDVSLIRRFAWSKTKYMEDDNKYFDDTDYNTCKVSRGKQIAFAE